MGVVFVFGFSHTHGEGIGRPRPRSFPPVNTVVGAGCGVKGPGVGSSPLSWGPHNNNKTQTTKALK